MLFITRDVGITAHFCDRVAVLYAGEIMEIAPREDLFLRPRHPYTLMLLAAFSHNPRLRDSWTRADTGGDEARDAAAAAPMPTAARIAQPVCRAEPPPLCEIDARPLRALPFSR